MNKEGGEKVLKANGKASKVHAINIFGMENYILATVLDPRFKTTPFEGKEATDISKPWLGTFMKLF